MSGGLTCKQKFNYWLAGCFQGCPAASELPGAQTVIATREIISASYGMVSTLVFTEAANIFQGALLSSSASVASAVSAALVMPFNYSIIAILASAMRASKNFFDNERQLYDGTDLGQRWRTALLYAFITGTVVGIPSFILAPHLISLLSLGALSIENTLSVSLALSFNLITMATVPLRMMRAVDRQLFLKTGHHNKWMMGMGFAQMLLTCGASYGLNALSNRWSRWPLSPAQSIACGGVLSAVVGLIATQIYLWRKSKKIEAPDSSDVYFSSPPVAGSSYDYGSAWSDSPVSTGSRLPEEDKTSLEKYNLYQLKSAGWFSAWEEVMDRKAGLVIPGAHNALSYLAETLSNLSLIGMMGYMGPVEFIANNIASQAVQLFILLDNGLSMGLQKTFTETNRQKQGFAYLRAGFLLALGVSALSVSAYGLAPWIISCFVNAQDPANQEIINLAKDLIFQYVFFSFGDHLRNIISGANHAARDTKFMMWTTVICRGLISTGLSAYLGFHAPSYFPAFLQGARGIVSGHFIGVTLGAIAQTVRACGHVKSAQQAAEAVGWQQSAPRRPASTGGVSLPGNTGGWRAATQTPSAPPLDSYGYGR